MQNTEPGSQATVFSFPASARASIIVGLAAQLALLTCSIYAFAFAVKPPDVFMLAMMGTFFVWLGTITLRRLRAVDDRVAVDDTAVWYLPRRGVATCIRWSEIARLRQHRALHYLTMADTSGTRKIKLEYGLENLDKLRKLIHERTATQQA